MEARLLNESGWYDPEDSHKEIREVVPGEPPPLQLANTCTWLASRLVSVLASGAWGREFNPQWR